jgi:hypothetical protein
MNGQELVSKLLSEYGEGSGRPDSTGIKSDSMQAFAGSGSPALQRPPFTRGAPPSATGRVQQRGCGCGSNEESYWHRDEYGFPVFKVCPHCKDEKLREYRHAIKTHYSETAFGADPDGDPLPAPPAAQPA